MRFVHYFLHHQLYVHVVGHVPTVGPMCTTVKLRRHNILFSSDETTLLLILATKSTLVNYFIFGNY